MAARAAHRAWPLACACVVAVASAATADAPPPLTPPPTCHDAWCDPSADIEQRVASLLSKLTFGEKLSQLQTTHTGPAMPGESNTSNHGYVERLGLETYSTAECLHGLCSSDRNTTVFPQSITLAASWDKELVRDVAAAIGAEARGLRNLFEQGGPGGQAPNRTLLPPALACFSPQINIVRDPRWGRAQETYGESPTLTGLLAAQYVAGLQGNDSRYLQAAATPKHFDAYGGATTRGHRSPTEVTLSWRDWVETFLPAFRRVLGPKTGGGGGAPTLPNATAASTMCSYNTLCVVDEYSDPGCPAPSHGVPACADRALLTDLLRGEWGWDGYVISDAGAIKFVQTDHEWAASQPEAAADALLAGADVALGGGCDPRNQPPGCISFGALGNATALGLVTPADVDRALARVLRVRFRLGLMDPPGLNPYTKIPPGVVDSAPHRDLARAAARAGVVLLQNRGGALPIVDPARRLRVAVVGPNAMLQAYGNYAAVNSNFSTALVGVRRLYPSAAYARGCDVASNDTSGFADAVAAARDADVTVAVMGIDTTQEFEGGTRAAIELPGVQSQLLAELVRAAAGNRTLVLVLVGGSAMAVPDAKAAVGSIVWAGYGGEEAGAGLADVLFGAAVPAGRLPVTFCLSTADLAPFESYDMRAGKRTFRFLDTEPLWSFGHGESYAAFAYGAFATRPPASAPVCGSVAVSVTVTRLPAPAGRSDHLPADEVVQVYVAVEPANATGVAPLPRLRLADFARLRRLAVGESRRVSFEIRADDVAVVNPRGRAGWELRPGAVRVWVGGRQPTVAEVATGPRSGPVAGLQTATLSLTGPVTPLAKCSGQRTSAAAARAGRGRGAQ